MGSGKLIESNSPNEIDRTENLSNGKFIERKVYRTVSFVERKVYRTESFVERKLNEQQLTERKIGRTEK